MSSDLHTDVRATNDDPFRDNRVLHCYLAAEFRRAILWMIGGAFLIPGVALGLGWWQQKAFQLPPMIVALILPLLAVIWGLQCLAPRVRIDRRGISQRCFWWWVLWPWEAFAEGRIRLGGSARGLSYEFPERRGVRRTLSLELLEKPDAEALNRLIRKVWVPPVPPLLPESVQASFSWPHSFRIEMTADRFTFCQREQSTSYRWDEIKGVTIWRMEHARSDFAEAFLELPEKSIHVRGEMLSGTTKADFVGVLCQYVDRSRVNDFALNGKARSFDEVTERLKRLETRTTALRSLRWLPLIGGLSVTAVLMITGGWKALAVAPLYLLLMFAVHWMRWDRLTEVEEKHADLENQKRAFGPEP
jgi:hypothetical protein